MSFEKVITEPCIVKLGSVDPNGAPVCPTPPPPDDDCNDPAFRLANPGLCDDFPRLIIKPGSLSMCQLQSRKLAAYLVTGSVEVLVEVGVDWNSSNHAIVTIGGTSGKATSISEGIATISAMFDGKSAFAQITVLPEDCCENIVVGTVLIVDNSLSMTMNFNPFHATKLTWSKSMAHRLATELNKDKDLMSVMSFADAGNSILDFTNDVALLQKAILDIPSTTQNTNIGDALADAVAMLDGNPALDRKAIILISDLNNNLGVNPGPIADAFENSGGVITVIGVRSFGSGFALGGNLASTGFFLNAYDQVTGFSAADVASGLKGYYCAGNCDPPPGVANLPALNYDQFINWDVMASEVGNILGGTVDLIGGVFPYDLFDFLPGNGLYVDMAGTSAPFNGRLRSKTTFEFLAGQTYRLTFDLAGSQREHPEAPPPVLTLKAWIGANVLDVTVTDNDMPFTGYTLEFTPSVTISEKVNIRQMNIYNEYPVFGLLLDNVLLVKDPDGTPEVMLDDDFDGENPVTLPLTGSSPITSPCAPGDDYCYGYGCLSTPPPEQFPDPVPQPDTLELI